MPELLTGTIDHIRYRARDGQSKFTVASLEGGQFVTGEAEEGELISGVPYDFYGRWHEHPKHGKSFRFAQFVRREPHARHGVMGYLARYARNIGPRRAAQLYDAFGSEAVKVLRTQPAAAVGACPGLTLAQAEAAAADLRALVNLEDCKIELTNLFAGRGFPGKLVDAVIQEWGILAPARVKRDPFALLVGEFAGCGFARCDRLYCELGLPPERIKRQVICLWHILNSDLGGHTWFDAEVVVRRLGEHVSGAAVKPSKAIRVGLRAGWLASKEAEGKKWLADGKKARNEGFVAEKVRELVDVR